MKKGPSYSKRERRIISLGYLWRWGSIAVILIIPAIAFGICSPLNIPEQTKGYIVFLSAGITMLCVAVYEIVGTVLGLKHLLVALQLMYHLPAQRLNPRRDWTKSEKREYIGIGIFFATLGIAIIIILALMHLGIIN